MQLEFDVNPFRDVNNEVPSLVTKFNQDKPIGPGEERPVAPGDPKDVRPERLFLNVSKNVPVRLQLSVPEIDLRNLLAFIIAHITVIFGAILDFKLHGQRASFDDATKYYDAASANGVKVKAFLTSAPGVVHAKMCIVDDTEALVISSPFTQGYFDGPNHAIDDPRRGGGVTFPIHDVSLAVRGPAVADLQDAFRLHWSVADPGDTLRAATKGPPIPAVSDPEYLAPIQVIRTLPSGRFTKDPELEKNGEAQILEAYRRAIGQAKTLIYLENQYFTNVAITQALIAALTDPLRPKLQVIVLINVTPDIPFYTTWQRHRIEEIFKEAGTDRIEFFASWTHEPPSPPAQTSARITGNYFHSKVGIVDDLWATVGSANLDGNFSMRPKIYMHCLRERYGIPRSTARFITALTVSLRRSPLTDFAERFGASTLACRLLIWSYHLTVPMRENGLNFGGKKPTTNFLN